MVEFVPVPWIPHAAKVFLDAVIRPSWRVFEYGSGNSTFYFANKYCQLVSVEHDPVWYNSVKEELGRRNLGWVQLHHLPIEAEIFGVDRADPKHYYEGPSIGNYQQYVTKIDEHPKKHFHIVMVDGVARPSCLWHARAHIRPGGYLILDNSDREYYLEQVGRLFKTWERYYFWGHGPINPYQWGCTIWRRPRE